MFEGSKLSLRAWFMAIYLMMSTKKTVASTTLAQQLDATQKTAWFLELRIRQTFKQPKNQKDKLTGEVELDECFVGSKNKNRHWNKKVPKSKGRCHIDKVPVIGMLERDGRVCKVAENTHNVTISERFSMPILGCQKRIT